MFKKLLKYDMKAVGRLWWISVIVVLTAAVAGALSLRFLITSINEGSEKYILLQIAAALLSILCVFAIALSFVLTMILVYVRFYTHFFTDEGYLTFTLPASRKALLLSKTINALIWYSLHFLLIFVALTILILIAPPENIAADIFGQLGELLSLAWNEIGGWTILFGIEMLLFLAITTLFGICAFQFCITFGSVIAKKAKVIASIGIYYAFNSILSFIGQIGAYLFAGALLPGMMALLENANASVNREMSVYFLGFMIVIALISAVTAVLYCTTQHMIDRKLNLA